MKLCLETCRGIHNFIEFVLVAAIIWTDPVEVEHRFIPGITLKRENAVTAYIYERVAIHSCNRHHH